MKQFQLLMDNIKIAEIKVETECLYSGGILYWPFLKIKELFIKPQYPNFITQIYYSLSDQSITMIREGEIIERSFESLDQASDYAKSLSRIYKDAFPLLYSTPTHEILVSFWSMKSNDNSMYENLKAILKKYSTNQLNKNSLNSEMLLKQQKIQSENLQEEYNRIVL